MLEKKEMYNKIKALVEKTKVSPVVHCRTNWDKVKTSYIEAVDCYYFKAWLTDKQTDNPCIYVIIKDQDSSDYCYRLITFNGEEPTKEEIFKLWDERKSLNPNLVYFSRSGRSKIDKPIVELLQRLGLRECKYRSVMDDYEEESKRRVKAWEEEQKLLKKEREYDD